MLFIWTVIVRRVYTVYLPLWHALFDAIVQSQCWILFLFGVSLFAFVKVIYSKISCHSEKSRGVFPCHKQWVSQLWNPKSQRRHLNLNCFQHKDRNVIYHLLHIHSFSSAQAILFWEKGMLFLALKGMYNFMESGSIALYGSVTTKTNLNFKGAIKFQIKSRLRECEKLLEGFLQPI